jgi:hypothetical protein
MNLDLRPLTVSEFLDRTFSIYRHRFLLFVGLMAPQAVLALVTSLVANWISHSFSSDPNVDPLKLIVPLMIGGGALIVLMVLHYAVYALGSGATAAAVSDLYGRLQPEIGSAYRAAWRRVGPLLWLTFQISVRLFLVLLLCLGPPFALFFAAVAAEPTGTSAAVLGAVSALLLLFSMVVAMVVVIYMILRYAVAVPAVVLEPIGARAALRRSIALMRGRMLAALLLTACTVAVSVAASVMLQTPFAIGAMAVGPETKTGFLLTMIGTVTGTIGQGLTSPLIVIGMAVLYFDARVRHEALDLQIMTDALAAPVPSPAPGLTPVAPPPL